MKKHILALDLGRSSLGVAISRTGVFVTPLNNLHFHRDNYEECLIKLKELLFSEKIEHIVIGLPVFPSGDPCEMTPIVEAFIIKLQNYFPDVDIIKQDERNSTVDASGILKANGRNAKKQKENIDSIAALVILERYLKSINQL